MGLLFDQQDDGDDQTAEHDEGQHKAADVPLWGVGVCMFFQVADTGDGDNSPPHTRYLAHICCFFTATDCVLKLRATSFKLSDWLVMRSKSVHSSWWGWN